MPRRALRFTTAIICPLVVLVTACGSLGSETLEQQVDSCFERYTTGVIHKQYRLGMTLKSDNSEREDLTSSQLKCSLERLGFSSTLIDQVRFNTNGKFDTDEYQLEWETKQVSGCVEWEQNPIAKTKKMYCVKQGETGDQELKVLVKDYRK